MERTEVLDMMGALRLYGMKGVYDEALATAIKRKHEPQRFVGDLLKAEISEKQARSIKYQISIAKLPLAKDLDDFTFADTPINEALVRDLAGGNFLAHQRNVVLVGVSMAARIRVNPAMTNNLAQDLPCVTGRSWPLIDQMPPAVWQPSVNAVSRRRRGP